MVAVKQLTRDGVQGRNEFLVEVLMLTVLNHPHLVSLVGFCAQGDERLLVYEYMPFGSLESHLFGKFSSNFAVHDSRLVDVGIWCFEEEFVCSWQFTCYC